MASEFNFHQTLPLLIFQITCIYGKILHNVFITPENFTNNSNVYDVSIINSSQWNINLINQYRSNLQISIGSSFGFHRMLSSSIQLSINGSIQTDHILNQYSNMLFVFSDSNNRYFCTRANLYNKYPFQIYPSTNHQLAMDNSSNKTWFNLPFQNKVTWPMDITITNNPVENSVIYQYKDANNTHVTRVHYNSSFVSNSGLNIDIFGDNPNVTFSISSINISYVINESISTTASSTLQTTELIPKVTDDHEETTLKNNQSNLIGLSGIIGWIISIGILTIGIVCFISGICIGTICYQRNINNSEKNYKEDIANEPEELKKQLSSKEQFVDRFSITCNCDEAETEHMMTLSINNEINDTEESHESLYIVDENNYETPQTNGKVMENDETEHEILKVEMNYNTSMTIVNGEERVLKKQQTVSTNTTIIDNYKYNTLRIEYNVTGNVIYPDEGIV